MKCIYLSLLIGAFCVSGISQISASEEKATGDFIPLSRKVDELFASVGKSDSPGCAVGVIKDGKTIHRRGYGMANLEHDIPITPETVFNVASMSKQFTAMSIALLAQQGKISLDDDIRRYVPEIPVYENPITIRHLVYHTSGLRDYTDLIELSDRRIENIHTDKDILNILSRQKQLSFKPGEKHLYSNSGYFLMGIIVERVSGKSLGAFQSEFIFRPLGMRNTRLFDDRSMIVKNRATGYLRKDDGEFGARASLWDRVGDGGLLTTVGDLAIWDENFYNPKVGTIGLIERLTAPGKLDNGKAVEYAFGLEPVSYKGLPVIMHGGGIRGFRAQMYRFPEQKFTAICLCNHGGISPTEKVERIADIYLANHFKPAAVAPREDKKAAAVSPGYFKISEKELARFSGFYANSDGMIVRRLYVKDGKLWYFRSVGNESELSPLAANRFVMLGVTNKVEVVFGAAKRGSAQMSLSTNDASPILYHRVGAPHKSAAQLGQYAGTYYSEELMANYKIVVRGDQLVVLKNAGGEFKLTPRFADAYANAESLGQILFKREKGNRVTGFVLNTERTKGLYFKKL